MLIPRLLLVDDHELVRAGIARILSDTCEICGEASDGSEAIRKAVELRPDLVLLDLSMPGMSGTMAAREIRRLAPETKIIFLSMQETAAIQALSKDVDVDGCISKRCPVSVLYATIAAVLEVPYDQTAYEKSVTQFPSQSGHIKD